MGGLRGRYEGLNPDLDGRLEGVMLIIANEGAEQGLVRRAIVRKPEKTAHLVGQLADTLGARLPVAARERAVDEVDLCQRESFGLWKDGLVVVVQMAELV